jgi:NADH:ubiquinone oxidoreductase subunit K
VTLDLNVGLSHFVLLSAILFCIGLYGVLSKRNAVGILMGIEIMFNAVNVALVAFSRFLSVPASASGTQGMTGQIFALFIIAVAAAEASVALAIILAIYRSRRTVNVDEVNMLKW